MTPAGVRLLFVAGQTAANATGAVEHSEFPHQFDRALANTLAVVREAGGEPTAVARMTLYVTDMDAYRSARVSLSEIWRRHMGSHYPAMTVVQVSGLVEELAVVEIEATVALP
jgi:enamine deaminase RidA (YjgF/YER057c/UK114 family)